MEIKAAFQKMSVKLHPDHNRHPDAELQFREMHEIYMTLIKMSVEERAWYRTLGVQRVINVSILPFPWTIFKEYGWMLQKMSFFVLFLGLVSYVTSRSFPQSWQADLRTLLNTIWFMVVIIFANVMTEAYILMTEDPFLGYFPQVLEYQFMLCMLVESSVLFFFRQFLIK